MKASVRAVPAAHILLSRLTELGKNVLQEWKRECARCKCQPKVANQAVLICACISGVEVRTQNQLMMNMAEYASGGEMTERRLGGGSDGEGVDDDDGDLRRRSGWRAVQGGAVAQPRPCEIANLTAVSIWASRSLLERFGNSNS